MTIFGLAQLFTIQDDQREWYEKDTVSVDKNGINGTISEVGIGPFKDSTIIVNKTGIVGTTTEIV